MSVKQSSPCLRNKVIARVKSRQEEAQILNSRLTKCMWGILMKILARLLMFKNKQMMKNPEWQQSLRSKQIIQETLLGFKNNKLLVIAHQVNWEILAQVKRIFSIVNQVEDQEHLKKLEKNPGIYFNRRYKEWMKIFFYNNKVQA